MIQVSLVGLDSDGRTLNLNAFVSILGYAVGTQTLARVQASEKGTNWLLAKMVYQKQVEWM